MCVVHLSNVSKSVKGNRGHRSGSTYDQTDFGCNPLSTSQQGAGILAPKQHWPYTCRHSSRGGFRKYGSRDMTAAASVWAYLPLASNSLLLFLESKKVHLIWSHHVRQYQNNQVRCSLVLHSFDIGWHDTFNKVLLTVIPTLIPQLCITLQARLLFTPTVTTSESFWS